MTSLPPLNDWERTSRSLHRATQLLGAIRLLKLERVPNYLELATVILSRGLSTGVLPSGGEVVLDFQDQNLIYRAPEGGTTSIALGGHSQGSLLETLLEVMEPELGFNAGDNSTRIDSFMVALAAKQHPFLPKREDLADEALLEIDPVTARDYNQALYRVFTAAARFRARLTGTMTPVVVWPEHFDLSFLWFATSDASEYAPQMNFGFAPFSDGLPRPYLYAYAYPMPEGFEKLSLPAPAKWHTDGWNGVVVNYDELAQEGDPEAVIENIYEAVFRVLSPTLG